MFLQAASLSLFLSAVWTHTHTNTHANTQKHNAQVSTRREESKHDQLGRQLRCGTQRSVVTFSEKRFHVQQKAVSSGDTFPVKDAYAMGIGRKHFACCSRRGGYLPSSRKVWSCVAKMTSCNTVCSGPFGNACSSKSPSKSCC